MKKMPKMNEKLEKIINRLFEQCPIPTGIDFDNPKHIRTYAEMLFPVAKTFYRSELRREKEVRILKNYYKNRKQICSNCKQLLLEKCPTGKE